MFIVQPMDSSCRSGARMIVLSRLMRVLATLYRKWKNRREVFRLGELSDRELADIGLTRSDLHVAISSPFGTDPTSWLATQARLRALDGEAAARRVH